MKAPKDGYMRIRCSDIELEAWKRASDELDVSLSEFVRRWLNHAVERDVRGRLKNA